MLRLFQVGPRREGLGRAVTNATRIGTHQTRNAFNAPNVRARLRIFTCRVQRLLIRSVLNAGYVLMVILHSSSVLPAVMLCALPVIPAFSLQILRG